MLVFPKRYKAKKEAITIVQGEWGSGYTPSTSSSTTRVRNATAVSVEPGSTYLLTVEPANISFTSIYGYNSNGEEWSSDVGGSTEAGTKTITIPSTFNLIGINLGLWSRGTWGAITPENVTSLTVQKVTE
ncbi:MAG: hypothetical protein IK990_07530 [Ruminiclostridium sp.]|nr:hypothetical protein [Ruminiclostridium sp.]